METTNTTHQGKLNHVFSEKQLVYGTLKIFHPVQNIAEHEDCVCWKIVKYRWWCLNVYLNYLSSLHWVFSIFPHITQFSSLHCTLPTCMPHVQVIPLHLSIFSTPFIHLNLFPLLFPFPLWYMFAHICLHLLSLYFNHYISASSLSSVSSILSHLFLFFLSFPFCVLCSWHCKEKAVVWDGAMFGGWRLWPVSQ